MFTKNNHTFEICVNFIIWISAVLYSCYCFQRTSSKDYNDNNRFDYSNDYYFKKGWTSINRKQDNSDFEWQMIMFIIKQLTPWLFVHLVASSLIRTFKISHEVIQIWYILWSLLFVATKFNCRTTLFLLSQPAVFYVIVYFIKWESITLFCNLTWIVALNYMKLNEDSNILRLNLDTLEYSVALTASFWISLRCFYYYLKKIRKLKNSIPDNKNKSKDLLSEQFDVETKEWNEFDNKASSDFLDCFSYCLYLPTLFLGPFIIYEDFKASLIAKEVNINIGFKLFSLIIRLLKVVFWIFFVEFALHYFYVNVYAYHPQKVFLMDSWSLYGYGYCMGQFFHIKYVIMFGLSTGIASFDGMLVPNLPKCIGRIHLYSDMWKYFDVGLYKFLLECIYLPTLKNRKSFLNKTFSSFLCFLYIYLWHGLQLPILIWSALNFMGILTEQITKIVYNDWLYISFSNKIMERRFISICCAPLLAISAISNFYFFAGADVGNIFFYRLFTGGLWINSVLSFALYNCCQISHQIKLWEQNSKCKTN